MGPSVADFSMPFMSCSEEDSDVDETKVLDVSFQLIYTQHRITAFIVFLLLTLFTIYLSRDLTSFGDSIFRGFLLSSSFIIIVSSLVLPNGPFIRPHPVFWKIILGIAFMYCIILLFFILIDYQELRALLLYIDPNVLKHGPDVKDYAADCRLVWSIFKEQIDIFCLLHFFGWYIKALLLRDSLFCWVFSVNWEISEIVFQAILPNFKECWWDQVILDILLCNGLGILAGFYTINWLRFRNYHWESIKMIKDTKGKLKRFILQFSPKNLDSSNWFSADSILLRIFQLTVFSTFFNISELNTFFLKHLLQLNTRHWLVFLRCVFNVAWAFPAIRQYYEYITNPRIKNMGIYSWVYAVMSMLELFVLLRHGDEVLRDFTFNKLLGWLSLQAVLCSLFIGITIFLKNKKFQQIKKTE